MNRFCLLSFFFLSLFLPACDLIEALFSSSQSLKESITLTPEMKKNRCVKHEFRQGQAENLYGIECIDGKRIFIQTHKAGVLMPTTEAGKNLRLEKKISDGKTKEVDFIPNIINKFYKVRYTVQRDQGDDKEYPFLRDLLPENEEFYGSLSKSYHIVFKIKGNYLILLKASKDIEAIPYTHRTALPRSSDGDYEKSEGDYYMVPFIGYRISYCTTEREINPSTGRTGRYDKIISCDVNNRYNNPDYIRFQTDNRQLYDYKNKINVFPAKYFTEGLWFYSSGIVETASSEVHNYTARAFLVKLEAKENALGLVDVSGETSDLNQKRANLFSVNWKEYRMDKNDGIIFNQFQEKEDIKNIKTERPYIQINFDLETGEEITDLVITKDYFSFVKSFTDSNTDKRVKKKVSLLRESAVDQKGFLQKRWFKDEQEHRFGVLNVSPQTEEDPGVFETEEKRKHFRLIRFNTNKKETTIKWHFSNYTVTNNKDGINGTEDDREGDFYRSIGREAVEIWNRAFQIITEGSDKTIKVVLAEGEGDKDLGDLRYNILNLVKVKTLVGQRSSLVGRAPSFVKADSGQIVGTTSNVFIHNISKIYEKYVADYIRYEIFQKDHNSICQEDENQKTAREDENNHGVSPYIKSVIEKKCQEVKNFICFKKAQVKAGGIKLTPRDNLKDSQVITSCERKLSRDYVLATILHEMGHSFGLGHNFKASTDSDNYYENLEEMKTYFPMAGSMELPKTSSIMDYIPFYKPPMTVLGKYDLAALKYLYMDQLEKQDGSLLTFNIPENPDHQTPLKRLLDKGSLSQLKVYAHCGDAINNNRIWYREKLEDGRFLKKQLRYVLKPYAEDFLCLTHDYGSTPLEIVQSDIEEFKRTMKVSRYIYANDEGFGFSLLYRRILGFYKKWINLRHEYFRSIGKLEKSFSPFNDTDSIERYKALIENISNTNKEFALYYPAREIIFKFIKDVIFLKTMKCEIQDNDDRIQYLDLDFIKRKLLSKDLEELYVEDCRSEHIQSFFADNHLTYLNQTGLENFSSYYSKGINNDRKDLIPVSNILRALYLDRKKVNEILTSNNLGESGISFLDFIQEPDFLSEFFDRLKTDLLLAKELGASGSDLKHLVDLLKRSNQYLSQIHSITNHQIIKSTIWDNQKQFLSLEYTAGIFGEKSFYKRVQEPLNSQIVSPEEIFSGIPFLKEVFQEYSHFVVNTNSQRNFQSYLVKRDETLIEPQNFAFRIPFEPGGFVEEVIVKHNKNLEELEKLKQKEKKEGLTTIEEMEKAVLEIHNHYLKQATEIVIDI